MTDVATNATDLDQRVRERAYALWEEDGRPDGRAEEHWHRAKNELATSHSMPAQIVKPAAAGSSTRQ